MSGAAAAVMMMNNHRRIMSNFNSGSNQSQMARRRDAEIEHCPCCSKSQEKKEIKKIYPKDFLWNAIQEEGLDK